MVWWYFMPRYSEIILLHSWLHSNPCSRPPAGFHTLAENLSLKGAHFLSAGSSNEDHEVVASWKQKVLFKISTTFNYHKEDFSIQGVVQSESNTKRFNTLYHCHKLFPWLKSVSELHTIQKREKGGGPRYTGWNIQYWILNFVCITTFFCVV